MEKKKVLVAMSGGVDSSVAALLLRQQGHEVGGATFRLFAEAGDDAESGAKAVCAALSIPHYTLDYQALFAECVIAGFVAEYARGATPNPCVQCNRFIKFPAFLQSARKLGYTHIATGHYAGIERDADTGLYRLRKAAQQSKDQSYVLYNLTQELLAASIFPLEGYCKDEIRAIAKTHGFASADKPESQDICFIPDGDYGRYLQQYTGQVCEPGNFVDLSGNVLGRHKGIWHYTVGQRKGLGVSFGKPMFVASIDSGSNTVALAEDAALYTDTLEITQVNYLSGEVPSAPFSATVRIRYGHQGATGTVYPLPEQRARVVFGQPQRAVTKGQSAVLYQGEYLLGGGIIVS